MEALKHSSMPTRRTVLAGEPLVRSRLLSKYWETEDVEKTFNITERQPDSRIDVRALIRWLIYL